MTAFPKMLSACFLCVNIYFKHVSYVSHDIFYKFTIYVDKGVINTITNKTSVQTELTVTSEQYHVT